MKWIVVCLALAGMSSGALAQTNCPPPKVMTAAAGCVCPKGTHPSPAAANVCVPNQTCPAPKVLNAAGACVCPPGTHQAAVANICVSDCKAPKVMDATGKCVCPPGTHQAAVANICVKN